MNLNKLNFSNFWPSFSKLVINHDRFYRLEKRQAFGWTCDGVEQKNPGSDKIVYGFDKDGSQAFLAVSYMVVMYTMNFRRNHHFFSPFWTWKIPKQKDQNMLQRVRREIPKIRAIVANQSATLLADLLTSEKETKNTYDKCLIFKNQLYTPTWSKLGSING